MASSPAEPDSDAPSGADADAALDRDLQDLEKALTRLLPAPPRQRFWHQATNRGASMEQAAQTRSAGGARRWLRVLPLGLAAVVTLVGMILLKQLAESSRTESLAVAPATSSSAADQLGAFQNLVPVSVESSLREVVATDIVVVEGQGLMRPVLMHYEAAQCWMDPETQTTIQVIQPWQETVFYPVSTY